MGGIAIGLCDDACYSILNPATIAALDRTVFSGVVELEYLSTKDRNASESFGSVYLPYLFWGLPAPGNIKLGFSFSQQSRLDSESFLTGELDGQTYDKTVSYSGGLNVFNGLLGYRFGKTLLVGANVGFLVGSFEEVRSIDFWGGFEDSDELIQLTHPAALRFSVGVKKSFDGTSAGGFVELPSELDLTWTRKSSRSSELSRDGSLSLPLSFGFGISRNFGGRYLGGMDVYVQPWSSAEWTGPQWVSLRNGFRAGVGVERIPQVDENRSMLLPDRAGYSFRSWPWTDALGNSISEHRVSLGFDIPSRLGFGGINVAVELGIRGTLSGNDISERFLRTTVSAAVGEQWKRARREF
jgi:hypothetical protein